MNIIKKSCALVFMVSTLCAPSVLAKVPAAEADKLGKSLTPVGAEKAGNADGTIPAWDGGLTEMPAGFTPGKGNYVDPYADDKPLFTITKDNMADYADKLSDGQMAMMNKYPSFVMNIYPTRRPATYSDTVIKQTKKNALNTVTVDDGNGISNFEGVNPFPIPKAAKEVVWNHIMRDRGGSFEWFSVNVTPTAGGDFAPIRFYQEFAERSRIKGTGKKDKNVLFFFKQTVTAPARLAGNVLLAHETIDQVREPRRAWIYNAGQRRVRRAPQVGYDGPGTAADGLSTSDDFDMYNGAQDRYDWTLVGKKEMYVPYNSYKIDDKSLKYDDLVKAGHLAQEYKRYELHRVWVVEANLKKGKRHVYHKRQFYFDEDSWGILIADSYDGRGELWRHNESQTKLHYDVKTMLPTINSYHDLISGRYLANGLANEEQIRFNFAKEYKAKDFTPAALRRSGKR